MALVPRPEPVYAAATVLGSALFRHWRLAPAVSGADRVPASGPAVLAITHFGYLEFALSEWVIWRHRRRRVRFLVEKRAFDKTVVGAALRAMRHICVDPSDGSAAFAEAVAALRRGELVGIFPEAGVSASFTVREIKTGAARMAAEADVPLIPVALWGGHRLLTKGRKIAWRDRYDVPISMACGDPIQADPGGDVRRTSVELRAALQSLIDSLQESYPHNGTGQWWQPRALGGTAPTPAEAALADAERDRRRASEAR